MDRNKAIDFLNRIRTKKCLPFEMVHEWNDARKIPNKELDLAGVELTGLACCRMNFSRVNFEGANLSHSTFMDCEFIGSNISNVDFRHTQLWYSYFGSVNFSNTKFCGADLQLAVFQWCKLHNVDFTNVRFGGTIISSNMSTLKGMDSIIHHGPSTINVNAIISMKNNLSVIFLKGIGLRDEEIQYFENANKTSSFNRCFISYSSKDEEFASKLYNDLQDKKIQCWKWDCDAKTGNPLWGEIDRSIRAYDKLLLVASKHSLTSPAVLREIERAIQKEDELQIQKQKNNYSGDIQVLFPVRLDDFIFEGWDHERKPDVTRKFSADARNWKDDAVYSELLSKLIDDLKK